MPETNRQITLAQRPYGFPKLSDFKLVETPIPNPEDGELLIRNEYMSVDPYMRGRMNEGASYAKGVEIGDVMVGGTVGQVIESNGQLLAIAQGWIRGPHITNPPIDPHEMDAAIRPLLARATPRTKMSDIN